ncbi:hypothetical protein N0V83_008569 [Neocucurbitaria cava]|uniref:Uncharacterized protein n=1 Tax=Neocucurbitaria cava TaxID=798079 RepID=A0A9W9CJ01_9PLEO|nr:hypothetical protein N0V83_008569 [Neocucurbitaria cava]
MRRSNSETSLPSETPLPSETQIQQLESLPSPIETRHTDGATSSPATIARTLSRNSDRPAPTPPDAAFYRWFGLLADDAALADANDPSLSLWAPPTGAAGANAPQSFINGLSVKTFRERYAIPRAVAPCLSLAPSIESTSRHSWHGTEPAQLSRDELDLFRNFVVDVSVWVSTGYYSMPSVDAEQKDL